MPTVLRWKGYRFYFYSADGWEPSHVHVGRDGHEAKVWLHDTRVAVNIGFSARELNEILAKTREDREQFLRAWDDYFADRD
jgi:hypothetical protein